MPLKQVRSFISENRQLLYVPSAQEIEKDGIRLAKGIVLIWEMRKINFAFD